MIPSTAAVVSGVAIGGGIALVVRGLVPVRPDLASALDRLHAPPPLADGAVGRRFDRTDVARRLGAWLDARAPAGWARTSAADLAILETARLAALLRLWAWGGVNKDAPDTFFRFAGLTLDLMRADLGVADGLISADDTSPDGSATAQD